MSIDYSKSAISKGKTRKQLKAKRDRTEAKVKKAVRAACVERDGYCRFHSSTGKYCVGPSEWAHLEDKKRARTMGMAPHERHTTARSMMLCRRAHRDYDAGDLQLRFVDHRLGADGSIVWILD